MGENNILDVLITRKLEEGKDEEDAFIEAFLDIYYEREHILT